MKTDDLRLRIGQKVREARLRHGWSQEDLAEKAEVHPSFIGQLERGLKNASLDTLRRLGAVLGMDLGQFLAAGKAAEAGYRPIPIEKKILGLLKGRSTAEQLLVYQTIRHLLRQNRRLRGI